MRGASCKNGLFPIAAVTCLIPRVKCAKTAKNAEHGCNPGRISQNHMPYHYGLNTSVMRIVLIGKWNVVWGSPCDTCNVHSTSENPVVLSIVSGRHRCPLVNNDKKYISFHSSSNTDWHPSIKLAVQARQNALVKSRMKPCNEYFIANFGHQSLQLFLSNDLGKMSNINRAAMRVQSLSGRLLLLTIDYWLLLLTSTKNAQHIKAVGLFTGTNYGNWIQERGSLRST